MRRKVALQLLASALLVLAPAVVASCSGLGGLSGGDTIPDGGTDANAKADSAPPDSPADTGAPPVDATVSDAGGDATGPLKASCKEILAADANAASGVFTIRPGSGPAVSVYCDMTTAGGGWTLVGRSATNGSGLFGWTTGVGTVGFVGLPYSVDVGGLGLDFAEVLIGTVPTDGGVYDNAYRFTVPPGFVATYADASVPTGGVVTVAGSCQNPGLISTGIAGYTAATQGFFVGNEDPVIFSGLEPGGFQEKGYDDCVQGGWLNDKQGMILVR